MLWGASETEDCCKRLSIFLQYVGSFLIASVVMALVFQFWQIKGLLADMWEEADIVKSLRSARLSRFALGFQEADVPWTRLFRESDHVTVLFIYGRTWLGWHLDHLRAFLRDENVRLDVILPDPKNASLMQALALRFLSADEIKTRIEATMREFAKLSEQGKGKVSLFAFSRPMVYSCYRFNTHAVLATYRHELEGDYKLDLTNE